MVHMTRKRHSHEKHTKYLDLQSALVGSVDNVVLPLDVESMTAIQKAVIVAVSDPLDYRSDKQLQKDLEVSQDELRSIKRDPTFKRIVNERMEQALRDTKYALIKQLVKNALSKGDTVSLKALLEMQGAYAQQIEVKSVNLTYFKEVPTSELWERVQELQADLTLFKTEQAEGLRVLDSKNLSKSSRSKRGDGKSGDPLVGAVSQEGLG